MNGTRNIDKIAYMITVYTEPQSLKKLVKALKCDEVDFYIHIDKKVERLQFESLLSGMSNVHFLKRKECCKIKWGGVFSG